MRSYLEEKRRETKRPCKAFRESLSRLKKTARKSGRGSRNNPHDPKHYRTMRINGQVVKTDIQDQEE